MSNPKYEMTISLNVLKHLGIKLYSNFPAVISEVVANAWDADASKVEIDIKKDKIIITDNGSGMTVKEANERYLLVGYEKRNEKGQEKTLKYKRPVMGRKGIGKLSLFSIANIIEVQSCKGGVKHGFVMETKSIEELLTKKKNAIYMPRALPANKINMKNSGTKIVIKDLKKRTDQVAIALKKRIARRFSIIGASYKFNVLIDGKPIAISDRDYFHKIQYLWYFGTKGKKYTDYCKNDKLEHKQLRPNKVGKNKVSGWIGSVTVSGDLKDGMDNLNKIVIMVRGKLAQEDILEDFAEGGLYTKYLIGEIQADFLDVDSREDITTSNRQEIMKDDIRYQSLQRWIRNELKNIQEKWTDLRNEGGTKQALEIPAIKEWFDSLKSVNKKKAKSLFGKINQLTVDSDEEKRALFKHAVLAFESFRYKENLDALDNVTPSNLKQLTDIFSNLDDIEATLYHQIIKERISVIHKLRAKVESNVLEKVMQKYLCDHLWLLDTSWDRATETPVMEQQVGKEFKKIDAKLTQEEKRARFDIKYKSPHGKHVIIELKRANVKLDSLKLLGQVEKYRNALIKILEKINKDEPVEVVCIVGEKLTDWTTPSKKEESYNLLATKNVRVVLYQELIHNAYLSYNAFLKKEDEAGKIFKLVQSIETDKFVKS